MKMVVEVFTSLIFKVNAFLYDLLNEVMNTP